MGQVVRQKGLFASTNHTKKNAKIAIFTQNQVPKLPGSITGSSKTGCMGFHIDQGTAPMRAP